MEIMEKHIHTHTHTHTYHECMHRHCELTTTPIHSTCTYIITDTYTELYNFKFKVLLNDPVTDEYIVWFSYTDNFS